MSFHNLPIELKFEILYYVGDSEDLINLAIATCNDTESQISLILKDDYFREMYHGYHDPPLMQLVAYGPQDKWYGYDDWDDY